MSLQKLIIEDDAGKTIVVPLTRDIITIGRKDGNTIRLTERNVSRDHAKLERNNGAVFVEDLGSYNGVKLNGDKIKGRVEIREGDLIEIGDYHLALQAEAAQAGFDIANDQTQTGAVEDDEYDQFAGDTQRWEPPVSYEDATVQDQAPLSHTATANVIPDETVKLPASGAFPPAAQPQTASGSPLVERTIADTSGPTQLEEQNTAPPMQPTGSQEHLLPPPGLEDRGVTAPMTAPANLVPPPGPSMADAASGPATSAAVPGTGEHDEEETQALPPAPAAQGDLALPRLVALTTVFAGSVFPLRQAETVIGRVDDNDMVIEHRSVSRSHAKIHSDGAVCRIVDLKSANGILLNGVEVGEAVLKSGDVIELGRVQLRYVPPGATFALSAEEIERARVADVAGEDFGDDPGTMSMPGVGVPRNAAQDAQRQQKMMFAALLGVIILLLLVIVILLFKSGDDTPGETVEVPTTTDGVPRSPLEDVRALNEAGNHLDALTKGEAALEVDAANVGLQREIEVARSKGKVVARKELDDFLESGEVDEANNALARLKRFGETPAMLEKYKGKIAEETKAQESAEDAAPTDADGAGEVDGLAFEPEPTPAAAPTGNSSPRTAPKSERKVSKKTKRTKPRASTSNRDKAARAPADDSGRKAAATNNASSEIEDLYKRAQRNFALGKCSMAKALAERGLTLKKDPRFYWVIGQCKAKGGNQAGAIKELTRVVNSQSATPAMRANARKKINELKAQ